ncbi:MAG: YggS family pyridoxal phosphate-dependent enzyme [Candidatus Omnitrophica bacterium]|nr:YggS family pyridoxal phosphate-dependent enzyme [Candidatus Omnitrophota bacterium]
MNRKDILQKNLGNVRDRIESACSRVNRNPDRIRLIAVTKYVDSNTVREMVDLGLHDFGENRIQVAEPKLNDLADLPIRWHWIGNLQTNKVRKVLGRFQEFHSIDRIPLIEAIDERLINHPEETDDEKIPAYLQVNVSGEETKSGFTRETVIQGGDRLIESPHLQWVGLMTMAPHFDDPEKTRRVFGRLRELRESLQTKLRVTLPKLSMGMSNDFEVAIEEGATDVRIGTILYEGIL